MSEPALSEVHKSAVTAAAVRALHVLRDAEPKILDDPFALGLSGWSEADVMNGVAEGRLPETTAPWVLRSRFAEDRLLLCRTQGIAQYVVLGAGLDTFAFRHANDPEGLTVFEVDDPPMQAWKRWRSGMLGLETPCNLHYVPCDLQEHDLAEALAEAGFDPGRPTFVSCLGVLQYLTQEGVDHTLRWIGRLPAGSEVILTYMDRACVLRYEAGRAAAAQAHAEERPGAPSRRPSSRLARSLFNRPDMRCALNNAGLVQIKFVMPEDLDVLYCSDRDDGMRAPQGERVVVARTAGSKRAHLGAVLARQPEEPVT